MSHPRRGIIHVKDQSLQQISIDPQFGCLHLQFSGKPIAKTVEHTDFINLDLDKAGHLVGIEFVGVKKIRRQLNRIFIQLANQFKQPALRRVPAELRRDLAVI